MEIKECRGEISIFDEMSNVSKWRLGKQEKLKENVIKSVDKILIKKN